MNKWIRWQGIGAFLVVLLIWFLFVDLIIKTSIESFGSSAVGAKVELDTADLSLFPLGLSLNKLSVTNPERPMENIIEAGLIKLELDSLSILRRKIIADTMDIEDLRFNTQRTSSGALRPSSSKNDLSSKDTAFALPGVSLPNTDALVEQQKIGMQKEIDSIQENINAIKTKWQNKQDKLPSKSDVQAYKDRYKAAKSEKNKLKKIKRLNDLRDDIKKDLRAFKGLNKELDADIAALKNEVRRAKNLPNKQADQLLADLGLDTSTSEITALLMSGKIEQWVDQAKALLGSSSSLSTQQTSPPDRGNGQWIRFEEYNPLPNLLIKRTGISGVLEAAGQSLNFKGEIINITDQPKVLGKPTTIKLAGSSSAGGEIALEGLTDRTTDIPTESLNIKVKDLALNNYSLSDKPALSMLLTKGVANSNINLRIVDGKLDGAANSQFSGINLDVSSTEKNRTSEFITTALSGVDAFKLNMKAAGTLDDPSLSISSDLDNILKKGLSNQLNQEKAALKNKIKAQLQESLDGELGSIEGQLSGLNTIKSEIDKKKAELDAIRK